MRDALAGIEFLRQQNKFSKVGVLGHSEGGLIAFMFGAKKQTDFIVSMAGPGVKGDTLLTAQNNRIMSLSGLPATMTVEKCRQQQDVQEMPWLRWFIDYDPTSNIRSTRCPVFALNGDLDCHFRLICRQVSATAVSICWCTSRKSSRCSRPWW